MRYLLLLACLHSVAAFGQLFEMDTIDLDYSMNGQTDSIDYRSGALPTTFEGEYSIFEPSRLTPSQLLNDYTSPQYFQYQQFSKFHYSALPYLGFAYSFGGSGTQYLQAKYYQVFNDKLFLNLRYNRQSTVGFIRNASKKIDDVELQLLKLGDVYSFKLQSSYSSDSLIHPGGVTTDTLIEPFGLEFSPVFKENSSSRAQLGRVELTNYIDLDRDSIRKLGVLTKHRYSIRNRLYREIDALSLIYDAVLIDSSSTQDRFNLGSIRNGAGMFFSNSSITGEVVVEHRYWKVLNLSNSFDTTELGLNGFLCWKLKKSLQLRSSFNYQFLGAFGEWGNTTSIRYKKDKWMVLGSVHLGADSPDPLKRSYFSNNYEYNLSTNELQHHLETNGHLKYEIDSLNSVYIRGGYSEMRNALVWQDSLWSYESNNISSTQLSIGGSFAWKQLHVHPRAIYTAQASQYLPEWQAAIRIYGDFRLFKAKKLNILVGCDATFVSEFKTRAYIPSLDLFELNPVGGGVTQPITNLHAFANFSIGKFRWFLRYENIGYFWGNQLNEELVNYPISGPRMRIGITWDFFN